MKRRLLITILLGTFLAPASAFAQWYLFPGSTTKKPDTTKFVVPVAPEAVVTPEAAPDMVRATLILPLQSTGTPSSNFLDFYSGALLAARDLTEAGIKLELNVFDSTDPNNPATTDVLAASDVVIGPVSEADIRQELLLCPHGKALISPLDPKAIEYTKTYGVIQAPTSWESQADELTDWLVAETRQDDRVVFLQNSLEEGGEIGPYVIGRLNEYSCNYTVTDSAEDYPTVSAGTTRFVLVSEDDIFCATCIRQIALLAAKEADVAVYSTSRIRSVADIDAGALHLCNARITASYFADPRDAAVRKFNSSYLGMFSAEPGSFAYQGYDTVHYFVSACKDLGPDWTDKLTEFPAEGLQTGFLFSKDVYGGKANTAVRRLRYRGDDLITIEKK